MPTENGPYLAIAVLCTDVIQDKTTEQLSLIRVFDRLVTTAYGEDAPVEMPATQFNFVIVLSLKAGQDRGRHLLNVHLVRPTQTKDDIISRDLDFSVTTGGMNFVHRSVFEANEAGDYYFDVYLDDDFMTRIPLKIEYHLSSPLVPNPPETS